MNSALKQGKPEIFSTGQGSQYPGNIFADFVPDNKMKFSMDSKGRAPDNIFIERFRRSLKYENIYLSDYQNGQELFSGLKSCFYFYNYQRPHQASGCKTPAEIYFQRLFFINLIILIHLKFGLTGCLINKCNFGVYSLTHNKR